MKIIPILLISLVLTGCGFEELLPEQEPEVIEKECEPIIKKEIEYIDRNITIPCNITNTTINTTYIQYNYTGSTTREIELIRRISFCESQQDKFINNSDCFDELNTTKVKLEDCEHELCYEWNSSWC